MGREAVPAVGVRVDTTPATIPPLFAGAAEINSPIVGDQGTSAGPQADHRYELRRRAACLG